VSGSPCYLVGIDWGTHPALQEWAKCDDDNLRALLRWFDCEASIAAGLRALNSDAVAARRRREARAELFAAEPRLRTRWWNLPFEPAPL
jgi:hypothetical protein